MNGDKPLNNLDLAYRLAVNQALREGRADELNDMLEEHELQRDAKLAELDAATDRTRIKATLKALAELTTAHMHGVIERFGKP